MIAKGKHTIVNNAQYYAAIAGFERHGAPHFAAGPYYAENWEDPFEFVPSVYVRVSDEGFAQAFDVPPMSRRRVIDEL